VPAFELDNSSDAHEDQRLPDLCEELLAALPNWNIHGPLDFGTNFTVRGPRRVLVSVD
jgi:hypothetical protein